MNSRISYALLVILLMSPLLNYGQDQIEVDEIIKKAKKNFTKELPTTPYLTKGYYVETAQHNGNRVIFMDAIGYGVYLDGRFNYPILHRFFHENTRIYIGTQSKEISSLYGNHGKIVPNSHIPLIKHLGFKFYGPLAKQKDYNFRIQNEGKGEHYVVSFATNEEESKLIISGELRVDKKNFHLISVSYKSEDSQWVEGTYCDSEVSLEYFYFDDRPFVSRSLVVYNYQEEIEHSVEFRTLRNEVKQIEVTRDEFWALNGLVVNPYIMFNENEWKISVSIPYPDYVNSAIEEIGGIEVLHSSSFERSGDWMTASKDYSGRLDFYNHKIWQDKVADIMGYNLP